MSCMQASREDVVTGEDVKFKSLLPCVQCGVHELPDSDGKLLKTITTQ